MLYTDTLSHRASYALYIRSLVAVDDVYSTCYVAPTNEGASIICKIRFTVLLFLSNKPVFSFLRSLTTWHYPHSHAALLCAVQQSIDVAWRPDLQQQTCSSWFAAVDRRTDGRLTDA